MRGWVTRGLKAVADLLLPRVCIACGRKLLLDEKHLCGPCLSDLPQTRFWTWKFNPMADRFNEVIQRHLEEEWVNGGPNERYAFAAALFFYDTESGYRHIPYQIKYHGNLSAGRHFGNMLGERLSLAPWFADVDVVIPVPLHPRRKWSRGYNQAAIIARAVADALAVPVREDILRRTRHTATQTKLDIEEKASNVKGAFAASSEGTFGHVLLVDDVFTTGSTLGECFQALRKVFPPEVRISVATLGFVGEV